MFRGGSEISCVGSFARVSKVLNAKSIYVGGEMNRKAILLAHKDGVLSTSKDMADVYRFLVSLRG